MPRYWVNFNSIVAHRKKVNGVFLTSINMSQNLCEILAIWPTTARSDVILRVAFNYTRP
jgi:hypothetical protein